MTVIDLSKKRPPVWYTVRIGHHWNDMLEFIVEDVADDPRSYASVLDAFARISGIQEPADAMHEFLLKEIEDLMDAKKGTNDGERLSEITDIVVAYENVRYAWNRTKINPGGDTTGDVS